MLRMLFSDETSALTGVSFFYGWPMYDFFSVMKDHDVAIARREMRIGEVLFATEVLNALLQSAAGQ